jgi:hypothetical protein
LQYLVPNLLQLYVDIEFTGSHTQVGLLFGFVKVARWKCDHFYFLT